MQQELVVGRGQHVDVVEHIGGRGRANELRTVRNVQQLKQWVGQLFPVICLIQNTAHVSGLLRHGAHWFVVFAYDKDGVFVTNYGTPCHLTWADFEEKWDSPISRLASVFFKGITNTSRVLSDPVIPRSRAEQFA